MTFGTFRVLSLFREQGPIGFHSFSLVLGQEKQQDMSFLFPTHFQELQLCQEIEETEKSNFIIDFALLRFTSQYLHNVEKAVESDTGSMKNNLMKHPLKGHLKD